MVPTLACSDWSLGTILSWNSSLMIHSSSSLNDGCEDLTGNGTRSSTTLRTGKIKGHTLVAPRAGLGRDLGLFSGRPYAHRIVAPAHDPFDRLGLALRAGQIDSLVRG
jgi:hypothetical protein